MLKNISLTRTDLIALAAANALASLGYDRRSALWLACAAPFASLLEPDDPAVVFDQETSLQAMEQDYAATGLSVGEHPAALIKRHAWMFPVPVFKLNVTVQKSTHGQWVTVFGMVTCRQAPGTAKGVLFVTLTDEGGTMNLIVHHQTYLRFRALIDDQMFICASGRLQNQNGAISILVKHIYAPVRPKAEIIPWPEVGHTMALEQPHWQQLSRNYQ